MKKACDQYLSGLADLAEGKANPDAELHVEECFECATRLDQLGRTVRSMKLEHHSAPKNLVEAAVQIMAPRRKVFLTKLVSSSFAPAGVRHSSPGEGFALYEAEGFKARLQYRRTSRSWEIVGQAAGVNRGEINGKRLAVDRQGRFELQIRDISDANIHLFTDQAEYVIPPIENNG